MKTRLSVIGVLASTILGCAVGAGTAQAGPRWPASCKEIVCINAHLNAVHAENLALKAVNKKQNTTIKSLVAFNNEVTASLKCFGEYPVSVDLSSHFLFETSSGLNPFAWTLADTCNGRPAIALRGGHKLSPIRKMLPNLFR